MNIDLDGKFAVGASPAEVFALLMDPHRFGPLLPYFRSLKDVSDEAYRLELEVGVPQIRGAAQVQVRVVERIEDRLARFRCTTKMALGVVDSALAFELSAAGTGTLVRWDTNSKIRGNLAAMAGGIIVPLARRNINAVIESLQGALGGAPVALTATSASLSSPLLLRRVVAWLKQRFGAA